MVTLAEDLFLLACDDATGRRRIPTTHLDLGLGGALLLDLVLRGRVALVHEHVVVVDRTPVGDALLDDALRAVAGDPRPREPDHWVHHLAKGARAAVPGRLVTAGVLRVDEHKVLGLVVGHRTHLVDGRIEHDLRNRLGAAVVLGRPASRETAALASLVLAVGLEGRLFPRSDRRAIRYRIEELAAGEWVGATVRHAIDAINAALGIGAGSGLGPEE
jgi:hypothetical protein